MGLFTNPVTLNDGTADHIFSWKNQINDSQGAIVGVYIEDAADLSAESKLTVKHDEKSSTVRRRLLQRSVLKALPSGELARITINLTATYNVEHTIAQIEPEVGIVVDATAETDFVDSFCKGHI
jgi:hypothetical protein